jgi:cob(I)alamin adenosyltransferase
MRIYTRKGDRGDTGILRGPRLSKADARIRALGALDELNASLGVVLSEPEFPADLRPALERLRADLMEAGAELALPDLGDGGAFFSAETRWLETEIDRWEAGLPPLRQFILPGGGRSGAALHWARALARRAESAAVEAVAGLPAGEVKGSLLALLNRISDALFVFARAANQKQGAAEARWTSRGGTAAGDKEDAASGEN